MRRWPVDGECLRYCLVAGHRIRTLAPKLRIGVAHGEEGLGIHAWLEITGRSLDPSSTVTTPSRSRRRDERVPRHGHHGPTPVG